MITVLILDGFCDHEVGFNKAMPCEICDTYISILKGILGANGIAVRKVKTNGFEHEYSINGKDRDNLIYVPVFSYCINDSVPISCIYTDSTSHLNVAFKIATALRDARSTPNSVIFINALHDNDPLRSFSPVIVDNIQLKNDIDFKTVPIYAIALVTAKCICEYYGKKFYDPAENI